MKQRKGALLLLLLLLVGSVFALGLAPVPAYVIRWRVIAGGGGSSSSGTYRLNGTIGQGVVGHASSIGYRHSSGFWAGMGVATSTPSPTRTPTSPPGVIPRVWLPIVIKNVWFP